MPLSRRHRTAAALVAFGGLVNLSVPAFAQDESPHDWLDRMTDAVHTSNYEGTVIRVRNGEGEALDVVHLVKDGVIHERVIAQEGNGLEIIRTGNEVQWILPDRKSVLVEEWNDQSALFTSLPSGDIRFGSEYDVSIVREEDRVAGRKAVLIAIRPHDEFRYGHRLWLDAETGFPLQTKLVGESGAALEQMKFARIELNTEIQDNALQPSIDIDSFRWFAQPKRQIRDSVASPWSSDQLPSGFQVVSAHEETLPGRDASVVHILYSDGLANVSVFVEPAGESEIAQRSSVGSSNSYSVRYEGYQVTAVGEVPAITVERIATSMRPN